MSAPQAVALTVTVEDYQAFVQYLIRHGRKILDHAGEPKKLPWRWRFLRYGFAFCCAGIAICLVILGGLGSLDHIPFNVWVMASSPALLFIGLIALLQVTQSANLVPQREGVVLGEHTHRIEEDGFHSETKYIRSLTPWPGIVSVEETRHHIFVMLDRALGHIVPKRAFANADAADAFARELRQRAGVAERR